MNKQFELLEFVLSPVMMRFLSRLLLGMCVCVVFIVQW